MRGVRISWLTADTISSLIRSISFRSLMSKAISILTILPSVQRIARSMH